MIFVKLKVKGTIFHDGLQNKTLTGKFPMEMKETARVKRAIARGVLVKITAEEAEKALSEKESEKSQSAAASVGANVSEEMSKLRDKATEAEAAKDQAEVDLKTANEALTLAESEVQRMKEADAQVQQTLKDAAITEQGHLDRAKAQEQVITDLKGNLEKAEAEIKNLTAQLKKAKK